MVSPSLNPRSSWGVGLASSFAIASSVFTCLKWSCNATLKSNESDLSPNPIPINAVRPVSSWIRSTKYRELSLTKN